MLSLGHLNVRERELLRISGQRRQLNITVTWPLTDLPLLVAMPEQLSLRFHHLADDGASIETTLAGWGVEPVPGGASMKVLFRLVVADVAQRLGDHQTGAVSEPPRADGGPVGPSERIAGQHPIPVECGSPLL